MDGEDKQRRRDSLQRKKWDRDKRRKSPPPTSDDEESRDRPRKKKWDIDEYLDNEDKLDWEPM